LNKLQLNKFHLVLSVCMVCVFVLLGGIAGGVAGNPCEECSADYNRLFIGPIATGVMILSMGIYQAWKQRWITVVTIALCLVPAAYYSGTLAQIIARWWDRL
jgi:hypothetical protein